MINRVMGKVIESQYYVDENSEKKYGDNGEIIYTFLGKPELKKKIISEKFEEICSFECILYDVWNANLNSVFDRKVNISENESVNIKKRIIRADLGEVHLFSDKVIEEKESDKESAEAKLKRFVGKFNKTMIEQDEKLSTYCKLHKLNPENTDCFVLWKVVNGTNCKVKNGKLVNSETCEIKWFNNYGIEAIIPNGMSTFGV